MHEQSRTHRVHTGQQHLCYVGVDLLYVHLPGDEHVREQPPLHLLSPLQLGLDILEPLINVNTAWEGWMEKGWRRAGDVREGGEEKEREEGKGLCKRDPLLPQFHGGAVEIYMQINIPFY